jgi:hypothetical protein
MAYGFLRCSGTAGAMLAFTIWGIKYLWGYKLDQPKHPRQ